LQGEKQNMKRTLVWMLTFALLLSQFACAEPNLDGDETSSKQLPKPVYSVQLDINCEENLMFSRYDIDVFVDDNKIGTFDHGTTVTYQLELEEGSHTLLLTKENERDVDGVVELDVLENTELSYKISCTRNQVEIEVAEKEESISNKNDPEESVEDPNIVLEDLFPIEYARRAVVVAMTNAFATDVFETDGNTYDPTLFHSYSDTSDYYMTVSSDGDWTQKDSITWHVEEIELKIEGFDTYLLGSMDVSYDGTNYIVSNVTTVIAALEYLYSDEASKINIEEMEPSESCPFLTVDSALIQDDRVISEFDELSLEGKDTKSPAKHLTLEDCLSEIGYSVEDIPGIVKILNDVGIIGADDMWVIMSNNPLQANALTFNGHQVNFTTDGNILFYVQITGWDEEISHYGWYLSAWSGKLKYGYNTETKKSAVDLYAVNSDGTGGYLAVYNSDNDAVYPWND